MTSSVFGVRAENYRLDIQGMRALAVLAVIVYHWNKDVLPGGYLGVDLFFVISGYVITGSLFRKSESGRPNTLIEFYKKRVARLLPALLFMLAIVSSFLLMTDDLPTIQLQSGVAAAFGASNLLFLWQNSNYFSQDVDNNPFLHTWSLGVEEQFYFVFPILFLFILRRRPSLLLSFFLGLTSLSAIAYITVYNSGATVQAFYFSPLRFWELLAGCSAFLISGKISGIGRGLIAYLGLLGVLCLFVIDSPIQIASFLVVIGGVLLVLDGAYPGRQFLAQPPFVFIGETSYSLYLWHWPVFVFAKRFFGDEWIIFPPAILVTCILAFTSYFLIEKPIRRLGSRSNKIFVFGAALASVGVLVSSILVIGIPNQSKIYTGNIVQLIAKGSESLIDDYVVGSVPGVVWSAERCTLTSNQDIGKSIAFADCTIGRDVSTGDNILVLGNSYVPAFAGLFDELISVSDHNIVLTNTWGAAPVPGVYVNNPWTEVGQYYWREVVPDLLQNLSDGDTVLLISDLNGFAPSERQSDQMENLESGIRQLAASLRERNVNLGVVMGTGFARHANCRPQDVIPQWFRPFGSICNFYSRSETIALRDPLVQRLRSLERSDGVALFDLFDVFCPGKTCTYESADGTILYRDQYSHPSVEAARLASVPFSNDFLARIPSPSRGAETDQSR